MRRTVLGIALLLGRLASAAPDPFSDLEALLLFQVRAGQGSVEESGALLRQLRNHEAMAELLAAIPPAERPTGVLYAASGSHMAPLVYASLEPGARELCFDGTEIDASVARDIGRLLDLLQSRGIIRGLEAESEARGEGRRIAWRFQAAGHPVVLRLLVDPSGKSLFGGPSSIVPDMIVAHDFSGDPQGNLALLHDLLLTLRRGGSRAPLLMMEDLEAHPYAVDLTAFHPLARTRKPYGHRSAMEGMNELGEPLYGGGVVLALDWDWWRRVDPPTLRAAHDFLLVNEFGTERRNVLSGGAEPSFSPILLDWWTRYGARGVDGRDLTRDLAASRDVLAAAARVEPLLPEEPRRRWSCRMLLYRCLLALLAEGEDLRAIMPPSRHPEHAADKALTTTAMRDLYREALAHAADFAIEKKAEVRRARDLLELAARDPYAARAGECPVCPRELPKSAADWRALYKKIAATLAD